MDPFRRAVLATCTSTHALMHLLVVTLSPLLPLIRLEFGLSYYEAGILAMIPSLVIGLVSLPAGLAVDRFSSARVIVLGLLLCSVTAGVMVLVSDILVLMLVLGVMGVGIGLYHPGGLKIVSGFFSHLNRGRVLGVHEMGESAALILAPVAAGFIAVTLDWRNAYVVWAAPAFMLAIFLLSISRRSGPWSRYESQNDSDSALAPLGRMMLLVLMVEGFYGFIFGGMWAFLPLYLVDIQGLSVFITAVFISLVLAAGAVGKFLGGVFSDTFGRKRVMTMGFAVTAPLIFIMPHISSLVLLALTLVMFGLMFSLALPAIIAYVGDLQGEHPQGVAYGYLMFMGFGFGSISRIVAGYMGDVWGLSSIFLLFTLASILGAGLTLGLREKRIE